ncbi:cytochrome P450 CYP82J17-like [Cornus florida]|uniref:cytochrome P450 CYP82J17-like n=1 Tax=Cornus florida TaxID=4283 RepID=UPI00289BB0F2|nr:cytochrome P450 CYP82J17-like [Cornus florida]
MISFFKQHCFMDFLSLPQAIGTLIALLLLYSLWRSRNHSQTTTKTIISLPPEPSGAWPLLGHLHQLASKTPVARILGAMTDQYGPIFTLRIGLHRALVVSSWEAVKECFTTNDITFASRPTSSAGKYLGYNFAGFGFMPYGPFWRDIRKIALLELLSSRKLDTLRHVRVSELDTSIKELYLLAKKSNRVVISEWLEQFTLNIVVKMIAGKRYSESADDEETRRFKRVIKEFMHLTGVFVLSDVIPFPLLRWIDHMRGDLKAMKRIGKEMDIIFESWVQEHLQKRIVSERGDEQDFIEVMLSVIDDEFVYGHTKQTVIKATILVLILGGSDTTSVTLTWLLSLLLNNNHALKHAQEEIDSKVGRERWVEESDIKNLVYLQAIVKETLRLYPAAPLSVPHEAREDCNVGGYHIPKNTRLLVNLWKLHRDPRVWTDPDRFMPKRFLTSHAEVDFGGQHFEYTPFGSGRRSCPGITFATQVTHLALARLLQGFNFTTPNGEPVDMTEGLGITMPKATPLEVVITPRLPSTLYEN